MKTYLRQFIRARRQAESPDFFREIEKKKRRRHHLILVIRRKYAQLRIPAPLNLETLSEPELETIRLALSKQIALLNRARTEKKKAA